jgi:hypothetical protein
VWHDLSARYHYNPCTLSSIDLKSDNEIVEHFFVEEGDALEIIGNSISKAEVPEMMKQLESEYETIKAALQLKRQGN